MKPNIHEPLSYIEANLYLGSPRNKFQSTLDIAKMDFNFPDTKFQSSTPSLSHSQPFNTIDRYSARTPGTTSLNVVDQNKMSTSLSFNGSQISYMSTQDKKITQETNHQPTISIKPPVLHIKLEDTDVDLDEFPQETRIPTYHSLFPTKTPLCSSSVKTLSEVIEVNTPLYKNATFRGTAGRKKMIFPQKSVTETSPGRAYAIFDQQDVFQPKDHSLRLFNRPNRNKGVFLNLSILKIITDFLGCGDLSNFKDLLREFRSDKKYKKLFKERMITLMLKGLSKEEQYHFWDAHINFKRLEEIHPFAFTSKYAQECTFAKDISKDLDRTLPEYEKYSTEEGKSALSRVLVAISHTIKEVGYIQGLNSIAGVFLFYLSEEKSYWSVLYMMQKLKVKDIFKDNFHSVHLLNYQLSTFVHYYLPEIASYLNNGIVEISYYTTPWFITIFSYFLSLENIVKTWNFFFLKGNAFLVQLGLAILSRYKEKILSTNNDELGYFFKYDLAKISEHDDGLFEEALKFKVSKRLLAELEEYYKNGKPSLKLMKQAEKLMILSQDPDKDTFKQSFSELDAIKKVKSMELKDLESPSGVIKRKELVQSLVETFTVSLPEAFKNMFGKNPSSTPYNIDKNIRTEPAELSESFLFISPQCSPKSTKQNRNSPSRSNSPNRRDRIINNPNNTRRDTGARHLTFTSAVAHTEGDERNYNSGVFDELKQFKKIFQPEKRIPETQSYREEPYSATHKAYGLLSQPVESFDGSPSTNDSLKRSLEFPHTFRPQSKYDLDNKAFTTSHLEISKRPLASYTRQSIKSSQYNLTQRFNDKPTMRSDF